MTLEFRTYYPWLRSTTSTKRYEYGVDLFVLTCAFFTLTVAVIKWLMGTFEFRKGFGKRNGKENNTGTHDWHEHGCNRQRECEVYNLGQCLPGESACIHVGIEFPLIIQGDNHRALSKVAHVSDHDPAACQWHYYLQLKGQDRRAMSHWSRIQPYSVLKHAEARYMLYNISSTMAAGRLGEQGNAYMSSAKVFATANASGGCYRNPSHCILQTLHVSQEALIRVIKFSLSLIGTLLAYM